MLQPPVYTAADGRVVVVGPDGIHWTPAADGGWVPLLVPAHLLGWAGAATGGALELEAGPSPPQRAGGGEVDDGIVDAEIVDDDSDAEAGDGGWLSWALGVAALVCFAIAGSG